MGDQPFVDVHVHFWDHAEPGLHWPWLEPGFTHRHLVDTHTLDAPRYTPPEFLAEAAGAGVGGLVHIQAVGTVDDPSLETAWLQRLADVHDCPDGIVGSCHLASPDAAAVLRHHAGYDRFRGIRDITSARHLDVGEISAAMDVADEMGISVELRRAPRDFDVLDEIAARWPGSRSPSATPASRWNGATPTARSGRPRCGRWRRDPTSLARSRPSPARPIRSGPSTASDRGS